MASSVDRIFIFEATLVNGFPNFHKTGELVGHESGVTSVTWSKTSEHKLVSGSFDNTIRIWNTETMECIAWQEYETRMYCALFMPSGKLLQKIIES